MLFREFSQRRDDTGISRAANLAGQYCGACHDGKTAFSVKDEQPRQCARCHMKSLEGLDERFGVFAAKLLSAEFGNGIDWARALDEGYINRKTPFPAIMPPCRSPKTCRNP